MIIRHYTQTELRAMTRAQLDQLEARLRHLIDTLDPVSPDAQAIQSTLDLIAIIRREPKPRTPSP